MQKQNSFFYEVPQLELVDTAFALMVQGESEPGDNQTGRVLEPDDDPEF